MLANTEYIFFNWKPLPRHIEVIYVITMCICHKFIDSSISGSNIQHSMLYFHKENEVILKKKCQRMMPTTLLEYLIILKSFVSYVYIEDKSYMKYQLHYLHLDQYVIQRKHDQNIRHLCNH